MSKSQPRRFILSTPTCVKIRPAYPRCLPLFYFTPSCFNWLPIPRTDVHVPLLSNVIKISGRRSLECQLQREMGESAGKRRVSLGSCRISSDVQRRITPHIVRIVSVMAAGRGLRSPHFHCNCVRYWFALLEDVFYIFFS